MLHCMFNVCCILCIQYTDEAVFVIGYYQAISQVLRMRNRPMHSIFGYDIELGHNGLRGSVEIIIK